MFDYNVYYIIIFPHQGYYIKGFMSCDVALGTPISCNTKQSSIFSSLSNFRPSLLVYNNIIKL